MPVSEQQSLPPLTIGWIPYFNLRPLREELIRVGGNALSFKPGHPTEVNRMLMERQVALAPSSSVCLLKCSALELALPLGVASTGTVQSVYLGLSGDFAHLIDEIRQRIALVNEIFQYSQTQCGDNPRQMAKLIWQEVDELKPLATEFAPRLRLSAHSASSVVLSKIFYRMMFGKAAYDQQVANQFPSTSGQGTLDLVIGDEALDRASAFKKTIDLGLFWKSITGLPFVYAVWQRSGKPIPQSWERVILAAAEIAEARMQVEPADYFPSDLPLNHAGQPLDLASYWRCIRYRLGPKDMQSLLLFLCLARPLIKITLDDDMIVRMRRWQEMSSPSLSI